MHIWGDVMGRKGYETDDLDIIVCHYLKNMPVCQDA